MFPHGKCPQINTQPKVSGHVNFIFEMPFFWVSVHILKCMLWITIEWMKQWIYWVSTLIYGALSSACTHYFYFLIIKDNDLNTWQSLEFTITIKNISDLLLVFPISLGRKSSSSSHVLVQKNETSAYKWPLDPHLYLLVLPTLATEKYRHIGNIGENIGKYRKML